MCPAMLVGDADVQNPRGPAVSHSTQKKKLVTLGGDVALLRLYSVRCLTVYQSQI